MSTLGQITVRGRTVRHYLDDEEGATALEYAVIVGILMTALIASLGSTGEHMRDAFSSIHQRFKDATT